MTTLKDLKKKYSGQAVPTWELEAAGLIEKPKPAPKAKREAKPDGDSNGTGDESAS